MTTKARQIVVAVDAGEPVQVAFKWALENILREGDHVALVNVRHKSGPVIPSATDQSCSTGTDSDNDEGYNLGISQIMDDMVKQLHERLQIPCDRIIKSGDPKKVICDEVTIREATALVTGCRGLDPVHRAFLGSVSDYCSRHADCAVITVRCHASS